MTLLNCLNSSREWAELPLGRQTLHHDWLSGYRGLQTPLSQPWHRTGSFLQPKCQRLKPGLGQRWVLGQSRTIDHSISNCRGYRFGAIHPHRTPKHQETEQTTRLLSTLEAVIATAIITLLVVFCIYFLGTLAMAEPINASALFLGPPRPAFTVLLGMVGHTISPSTLAHQTFYRASRGS